MSKPNRELRISEKMWRILGCQGVGSWQKKDKDAILSLFLLRVRGTGEGS